MTEELDLHRGEMTEEDPDHHLIVTALLLVPERQFLEDHHHQLPELIALVPEVLIAEMIALPLAQVQQIGAVVPPHPCLVNQIALVEPPETHLAAPHPPFILIACALHKTLHAKHDPDHLLVNGHLLLQLQHNLHTEKKNPQDQHRANNLQLGLFQDRHLVDLLASEPPLPVLAEVETSQLRRRQLLFLVEQTTLVPQYLPPDLEVTSHLAVVLALV